MHVAAPLEDRPEGPYLPASQAMPKHVDARVAPTAAECFPGTQEVHSLSPEFDWKVPAAHMGHASIRPVTEVWLPGEQVLHTAPPVSSKYCPGVQ